MFKGILSATVVIMFFLPSFALSKESCPISNLGEQLKGDNYKITLEGRHRFELRNNWGFTSSRDGFQLSRFRLTGDYTPYDFLRLYVQAQDSRVYESDFKGAARNGFEDRFDLRQGYAELIQPFDLPISIIVGRQELSYGEQRLIGGFNWSNVAQTFDTIRVRHETDAYRVDLFTSRKVIIEDDHFNERDHHDSFHGLYATWKKLSNHVIDLYVLFRDTDEKRFFSAAEAATKMDEVTYGTRIKGWDLNNWDYSFEIAGQGGNYGNEEIRAFALIAQLGYLFKDCPMTPHVFVEFAHASGDDDPGDGDRGTFDNLFPTNHGFYGWADHVSLQNINDIEFGVDLKPTQKLKVVCRLHLFYLDEKEDALYNAGRKAIRFDETGKASATVGQELDIKAKYKFSKNWTFETGYSHVFAGAFIEDTGDHKDVDYFYTMLSFNY